MRKILAVAGLAILAATPALAASAKKKTQRPQPVQSQPAPIAAQGSSYTVQTYTGSRIVGRDPDASVRQMLQAEDAIFRNIN